MPPRRRRGHPGPALARPKAPPAADDPVDRDPARPAPAGVPAVPQDRLRARGRQRRPGEQAAAAGRVPRVLRRVPAARPALAADPARHQGQHRPAGLDRDRRAVVAGELPRARQAGRHLPRLPAQDQCARSRCRGPSARCSSSGCSTCSRSRPSGCWPGSGRSATACPGDPGRGRDRHRRDGLPRASRC